MLMIALTTLNSKEKNVKLPKKCALAKENAVSLTCCCSTLRTSGVTDSVLISCHENPSLIFATDTLFLLIVLLMKFLSLLYETTDYVEFLIKNIPVVVNFLNLNL